MWSMIIDKCKFASMWISRGILLGMDDGSHYVHSLFD